MARLVLPDPRYRGSFVAVASEVAEHGRAGDEAVLGHGVTRWGEPWRSEDAFAAYAAALRAEAGVAPAGFVTHTTWWWVEDGDVLGRIDLRHELTEDLLELGGHVGYGVRPTARRQGHATAMLAAVLPEAARRGIDRVLVTCDHDNLASRGTIERNGGRLEDRRGGKLRYWVPTGGAEAGA